ncbi:pimeloyl-ACP methyl ester carboxylesterase [Aliiruegeria haliotis]|uniref:Pimeloyl-ACP methyl ester carboxylesterase n=1 Tax=Aliiruegeria haliotis TaxID=1280846 RepID=A0A2T0RR58_9RHOB|nr:alpha/beta fold hydrolase [Aliiruegeria haliotis]PRY23641.1 pimeloyl-ACP methyl ester carboxylesterase [Aliiruegeria haliotis]
MLGNSRAWQPLAEHLGDSITMYAPDMPGHGAADPWPGGGNLFEAASRACRPCLDARQHLLGHSFGAVVALRLAMERPELVRSLTLIEPVLFAALGEHPQAADQRAEVDRLDFWLRAGNRVAAARYFTETWGTGAPWDSFREDQRAYILDRIHAVPDQWPGLYGDCAGLLAPGRLEALELPVLLIGGGRSPGAISVILSTLARRLPRSRCEMVPTAGHMVPITHASETASLMRPHLASAPRLESGA